MVSRALDHRTAPAKARQLRKSTVEQLLKQHRIRRVDAETVIRTLREAASVHMRSLIARLRVINRDLQGLNVSSIRPARRQKASLLVANRGKLILPICSFW
jgi:hypothetical protein